MLCTSRRTYQSRTNGLIDALECQDAVSKVFKVALLIEERAAERKQVAARIFTQQMVKEVYRG